MFRNQTIKNANTRLRGFEGLETRVLMAADLFTAAPVDDTYVEFFESGDLDLGIDGIFAPTDDDTYVENFESADLDLGTNGLACPNF